MPQPKKKKLEPEPEIDLAEEGGGDDLPEGFAELESDEPDQPDEVDQKEHARG